MKTKHRGQLNILCQHQFSLILFSFFFFFLFEFIFDFLENYFHKSPVLPTVLHFSDIPINLLFLDLRHALTPSPLPHWKKNEGAREDSEKNQDRFKLAPGPKQGVNGAHAVKSYGIAPECERSSISTISRTETSHSRKNPPIDRYMSARFFQWYTIRRQWHSSPRHNQSRLKNVRSSPRSLPPVFTVPKCKDKIMRSPEQHKNYSLPCCSIHFASSCISQLLSEYRERTFTITLVTFDTSHCSGAYIRGWISTTAIQSVCTNHCVWCLSSQSNFSGRVSRAVETKAFHLNDSYTSTIYFQRDNFRCHIHVHGEVRIPIRLLLKHVIAGGEYCTYPVNHHMVPTVMITCNIYAAPQTCKQAIRAVNSNTVKTIEMNQLQAASAPIAITLSFSFIYGIYESTVPRHREQTPDTKHSALRSYGLP